MIIRTRYRNIPWDEAQKCLTPEGLAIAIKAGGAVEWQRRRGQPVEVIVPAIAKQWRFYACKGPHYVLANNPTHGVCEHIAELGD